MNELIKCPCCGSTAQPKFVCFDKEQDYYDCGCGCVFGRNHETHEIKIIEEN